MQIVSNRDNLHEMSNPIFGKNKKNVINFSSAERVLKVKFYFFVRLHKSRGRANMQSPASASASASASTNINFCVKEVILAKP